MTSQAVCDCLLDLFQNTGVFKVIVMDNASNFCSVLTTEFLKRLGVSPRFVAPYHAEANRLVERFNSSFKMFCTLPCVNLAEVGTKLFHCWSGCSASFQMQPLVYRHFLQYGIHPHAVLSLLKDNWTGFGNLPKSKTVEKYLSDLKETLEKTREFSDKHAKRAQEQCAKFYNTKAVDKSFKIGEQIIVLEKDSASKTFARWQTGEICHYHHTHILYLCQMEVRVEDICMQINCENWLSQLHTLVSSQRMMQSLVRYLLYQYCQIKLELQICPVKELI